MEFNRENSEVSMQHSGSDKDWRLPPRDSKISGDQGVRENSNTEGFKITSDRLDSDLVLGRTSSNSSPQCSDISSMETSLSAGKEKVMSNLCNLLDFQIRLSGSKIS